MGETKLAGNPIGLAGDFPAKGTQIDNFSAVQGDLSPFSLDDYKGKRKVLNISPSIDTSICATSIRVFNQKVSEIENTVVIYLSFDLPFAHKRFCGAEGIENVITGSLFRSLAFATDVGLLMKDGPMAGLTARAVIVLDENNIVIHSELVDDITHEPDYNAALDAL